MNTIHDVIIVGAGASGLAAAISAAEDGRSVLLLEKRERPGCKILASGNGRCNLMNRGESNYFGDAAFARKVVSQITADQLTGFFHRYGLYLAEESEGRVYPVTFQSVSVLDSLKLGLSANGVCTRTNCSVISVRNRESVFEVMTDDRGVFFSKAVIIAAGGAAQPKLGGSKDGYALLSSFGHTIVPLRPALVPVNTDHISISGLSGQRARCCVSLFVKERLVHRETGEVLFTDYGLSGICIMQCARFLDDGPSCFHLDFLSGVFPSEKDAATEFMRRRAAFSDEPPTVLLNGIVSSRLAYGILKQAAIPMRGETAGELSEQDIHRITACGYAYTVKVNNTRGFDYAQVTAGGADCGEFDPATMGSLFVPGLFACGEVLNVDGNCGGFNLMFAFSSGLLAGRSASLFADSYEGGSPA